MKLKYNLIAIALLGCSFSSCSDFLEQNPQTDLSEKDFYKTGEELLLEDQKNIHLSQRTIAVLIGK